MQYEPDEALDSAPVQADPTPPVEELPTFSSLNVPGSPEVVPPVEIPADAPQTSITFPLSGDDWSFAPPASSVQLRIQEELTASGYYSARRNGKWGDLSVAAIQEVVGFKPGAGLSKDLCLAIKEYVNHSTDDSNAVLTEADWEAFAVYLEEANR